MIFNIIESLLLCYGFDIYKGVLHKNFYMRKSLVCDLIEPFRVIIDLQVRKGINLKQFKEEDFLIFNNQYVLKWEKSREYTAIFLRCIMDYKEDIFIYIQNYYRHYINKKTYPKYIPFEI